MHLAPNAQPLIFQPTASLLHSWGIEVEEKQYDEHASVVSVHVTCAHSFFCLLQ